MKRISTLIALCLAVLTSAFAQEEPTTTWPYLFPDFTEGTAVLTKSGQKEGVFNICLDGGKLHYIDGDLVKYCNPADIMTVMIGRDVFQNVSGKMLKVLAKSDKCLVVEDHEIDYATLNSTGAAYGSSSNTLGNMSLTSLEGIGGSNSNSSLNHMELKHNKEAGKILPLITKNYIFVKGYKVFCTRKDVSDIAPDKAALKQFFKENSIKWKDPQSLVLVGDFLYGQLK